jgi:hypothetical protein
MIQSVNNNRLPKNVYAKKPQSFPGSLIAIYSRSFSTWLDYDNYGSIEGSKNSFE